MPKFVHERAKHLLAKNPDMHKSMAFGIATQQSHAMGKSPKDYGTSKGREKAKKKYDKPKEYVKTPNPGDLDTPKLAFGPSLVKNSPDTNNLDANIIDALRRKRPGSKSIVIVDSRGRNHRIDLYKTEKKASKFIAALEKLSGEDKVAFQVSQYSGPLSSGPRLRHSSYMPPFSAPPVKTAGPPSSGKKKRASVISSMAVKAKKVGMPKATAPNGPSIAQISKPKGFGKPIAGATKDSPLDALTSKV